MRDFNFWYFVIGVFGFLYGTMSWQGTQAYNASAENAHEARMAGLVGLWRGLPQAVMLGFVPIAAYTVLHHADYAGVAAAVQALLPAGETQAVRDQLKVPLVMREMMPPGMIGIFVALMLAASVTTFNSYLHSWGSILVQDVIIPLRGRPLPTRTHLRALRLSILFVAIFVFCFSLVFRQTQYIFLFFAITGAIFAGGSGAVIIGGLYWKRGTAAAAWTAMLLGSGIAVAGIIIHQVREDFFINGQEFWALAMGVSAASFVLVSLLGKRRDFDLDGLLGRHGAAAERAKEPRGWRTLWAGSDFTRGDRILLGANYVWTLGWFLVFLVGLVLNYTRDIPDSSWMRFWRVHLLLHVGLATITVVWFTTGGFLDLRRMFRTLRGRTRDHTDDGFVRGDDSRSER
jgi:SSS family solute:Na+ symporter